MIRSRKSFGVKLSIGGPKRIKSPRSIASFTSPIKEDGEIHNLILAVKMIRATPPVWFKEWTGKRNSTNVAAGPGMNVHNVARFASLGSHAEPNTVDY